jgi:hypothetical protein
MEHFGVGVRAGKYGNKLTRDNYAIISPKNSFYPQIINSREYYLNKFGFEAWTDPSCTEYSAEWCEWHLDNCLRNYDLSMEFFKRLNKDEFNSNIDSFLSKNKNFLSVIDLNEYFNESGYYIMVLDEYSQVYIGTTDDIAKRIREHWVGRTSFDRLLFPIGNVESSVMAIDSFRAFDTTRIYAYKTTGVFDLEDGYINQIKPEFLCNRLTGGHVLIPMTSDIKVKKLISL